MSDLIERQAAITAIQKAYADTEGGTDKLAVWKNVGLANALHIMQDLPSAQPEKHTEERTKTHACDLIDRQAEIVRCKNCKHQIKEWRTDKRLKDKGYMVCGCEVVGDACGFWALLGQDDDYCSYAERKEQNVENS